MLVLECKIFEFAEIAVESDLNLGYDRINNLTSQTVSTRS